MVDAMGNTVNAQASTATIVITVTDVNDNPPTFFTDNFVGSVSELAQTGNIAVAGVRAFDLDAVSPFFLFRAQSIMIKLKQHIK